MKNLLSEYSNLVEEWHPTKNGELKPESVTSSMAKRIWWLCSKDDTHSWVSPIRSRTLKNSGCPHCKKNKREGVAIQNKL